MNILSSLRRLIAWLAERDQPAESRVSDALWWDLPPHHPCQ